jgi:hypothetical protein
LREIFQREQEGEEEDDDDVGGVKRKDENCTREQ